MALSYDVWPSLWPPLGLQSGDRFDKPIMLPERGPATTDAAIPPRIYVDVNTFVLRADLGPNAKTFVAAHTAVPVGLESYPRVPA